jgi:hypothetical protein
LWTFAIATTIVATLVTVAGFAWGDRFEAMVPTPTQWLQAIWLAGLTGIAVATLLKFAQTERPIGDLVRRSRKDLRPELLEKARELAIQSDTDPRVVEAVILVENLQRPAWIRRIERALGRFRPVASYGVMQVQSATPLTDEQSLELGIRRFLAGVQLPGHQWTDKGVINRTTATAVKQIESFSPSKAWRELVWKVLEELSPPEGFPIEYTYVSGSTMVSPAQAPALEVREVELQLPNVVRVLAETNGLGPLEILLVDDDGNEFAQMTPTMTEPDPDGVSRFNSLLACPPATCGIIVRTVATPAEQELRPSCRFTLPPKWREELANP